MTVSRDIYVTTALYGLALYFVAVSVITVAILIASPGDLYFILFFAVPGIIVGAALSYLKRWGLVFGILGGAIGTLFVLEDIDLFLTTPQSFFDFSSSLFGIVGLLILLLASLIGTIQYFRGRVGTDFSGLRPAAIAVALVLALLGVISGIATTLEAGDLSAEEARGAIVLTAKKAKWDIQTIEAAPGQPLRILVRNDDPIMHTFTIHDLGIDERLGPWTEAIIEVESPTARVLGFICRIEGHMADMTGAIVFE